MDLIVILQNILLIVLIVFLCFLFFIFVVLRIVRKLYKFPIPAFFTKLIDNAWRRKVVQKPRVVAERLKLEPGMHVLEVGPGKGSYTKAIAERILPDGKVYAIDIQEYVIEKLKQRVEDENIPNIVPMVDDAYALSFEDEFFDRIISIACLPEIPDPVRVLREFKRVLKSNGIISLSELFPDPDYPLRRTEKKWARRAGLEFFEDFGNWFVYQLNFGKASLENKQLK